MKIHKRYKIIYKDGSTITCTIDWLLYLTNKKSIKKVVIYEVDDYFEERKIKTLHTKKEIRELLEEQR